MRAIIQRVLSGSVSVEGKLVSSIKRGYVVLVGIDRSDSDKDTEYIARKILNIRLFDGENGKPWDKSVSQKNFEILLVSQFTLYALLKGNKPDFHLAMKPDAAKTFWDKFIERMKKSYKPDMVKEGVFGALMNVQIENDGPVTIQLDSRLDQEESPKTQTAKETQIGKSDENKEEQ